MLNKYMNKAMQEIANMTVEEKMLYMSICFYTMDKDSLLEVKGPTEDLPTTDEEVYWDENDFYLESWATFANQDAETSRLLMDLSKKVQSTRKFTPKNQLRDKAKHGYKRGAAWSGFGRYDRFGKSEKMSKDIYKDIKAQMKSLDEFTKEVTLEEAVEMLWSIHDHYFNHSYMEWAYFHSNEWYDNLKENLEVVDKMYKEEIENLGALQGDLYKDTEKMFPEMGMSFQNQVVALYNSKAMEHITTMKDQLVHFLVMQYKYNREKEVEAEEFRHDAEMTRLENLMKEADSYIK